MDPVDLTDAFGSLRFAYGPPVALLVRILARTART